MDAPIPPPLITVLIPTMASRQRAETLKRAIASIRKAATVPVKLVVVVNGDRHDPAACAWLLAQPDVHTEFVPQPSLANAVLHGRRLVTTPYFATLDDDDAFTEGGLDQRLAVMESAAQPDLVISNGVRRDVNGQDSPCYDSLADVPGSPLAALFSRPWLNSGNALYRSQSIGIEYFEDPHAFAEWTWLAFKLGAAGMRIAVLETPTFVIYDTAGSLSKSEAYEKSFMPLYERMLALQPPADIVALIRRRMGSSWHDQSVLALRDGQRLKALRLHVRSLALPGGARYLSYSRYLIPGWPLN